MTEGVAQKASIYGLSADTVSPVREETNLPALATSRALATTNPPLAIYQRAVVEFGRASANVGESGGAPIKVPSGWGYFFRMFGAVSGGATATTLAGTAAVAALTAVEFTFAPTLIVAGVTALGSVIVGGIMGDEGKFRRWGQERKERLSAARGRNPLEASRVTFLVRQFEKAQPLERALLGDLAARWLRELDERRVIGKESRDMLRAMVSEAGTLPPELKGMSQRIAAVAGTIFDARGATMSDLDGHYARRVLAACDALTDEERATLVPAVRDILFQGEKPRVEMSFEACQALLEGLVPRKSANAN